MLHYEIILLISFATSIKATLKDVELESRIVNGDDANIERFPHMAFLAVSCSLKHGFDNWSCGGSILNQMIILTAAHCLEDCESGTHIGVSVGSQHKKEGAVYSSNTFRRHPKYGSFSMRNDIGLIKVKKSIKFNSRVKRVALMQQPPDDKNAEVSGWGKISEGNSNTFILQWTKQRIWSNAECEKLFMYPVAKGTFCAGFKGNNVGYVAKGDSGSALVIRGYIQVGLVSYKTPSTSLSVAYYADVVFYYDWIKQTAKELYCYDY